MAAFHCKELDYLAFHRQISEILKSCSHLGINFLIMKEINFQFDAKPMIHEATKTGSEIGDSSLNLKTPIPCNQEHSKRNVEFPTNS